MKRCCCSGKRKQVCEFLMVSHDYNLSGLMTNVMKNLTIFAASESKPIIAGHLDRLYFIVVFVHHIKFDCLYLWKLHPQPFCWTHLNKRIHADVIVNDSEKFFFYDTRIAKTANHLLTKITSPPSPPSPKKHVHVRR